ncbi:MAG: SulP family inorganic anion transporter [Planctomycetia bacterium]|nr:SulP family inorganic anion transporter [Planctomycetia bacterium]
MSDASLALNEKPQNGIAGLKHIRHDILSGIVVSLVSLPLSSGIAIASGVPPIYGLISAIIAGFIFPFIGGAYMTIAGPAAGLAPAIIAVMVSLGGAGDATHVGEGYPFLLVVIFMVGCCQLLMAVFKLARYAAMIPVAVVEGMLASIGVIIIVKQFIPFFGFTGSVHAKEFYEYLLHFPEIAQGMTPAVFAVAFATLASLFIMGALQKKVRFLQIMPPQLIAVVFGVLLAQGLGLGALNDGKFLIKIPENPFHGIHTPHFAELFARHDLWYAAIMGVIMLTLIDGVESLATAMAIDRIDPFHRRSSPNRVLLAMAISNIASSLVGGLTIIPGGVKSKVNVAAGGRTLWANFTNAVCLILYLLVGYQLINMIPLCVLAAVLIYTGWRMCEPLVWRHVAHIGKEQLGIFMFTIVATLATDLLIGIVTGVVAKFFLDAYLCRKAVLTFPRGARTSIFMDLFAHPVGRREMVDGTLHLYVDRPIAWFNAHKLERELSNLPTDAQDIVVHMSETVSMSESVIGFFQNPISHKALIDGEYHLHVTKPLVCFNTMQLSKELESIPEEATKVHVHIDERVAIIDHSSCDTLMHAVRESKHSGVPVEIVGLERMVALSHHDSCVRIADNNLLQTSA